LKILSIQSAKHRIGAVVHEKGDGTLKCELIDDFETIEATYAASRNRLLVYFQQVAINGLQALTTAQCHSVDANEKIYEFIAGKLRVLFFQGTTGHVIICSHMFLKKTQKTPPKEVSKAIRAKQQYLAAEAVDQVEWRKKL
jgi:phage-related protein